MSVSSKTLLDLIQTISFRLGDFKSDIEDLTNPDTATKNLIECVNEVMRDIWGIKPMPWMYEEDTINLIGVVDLSAATISHDGNTFTVTGNAEAKIGTNTEAAIGLIKGGTIQGIFRGHTTNNDTATFVLDDAWPSEDVTGTAKLGVDRYALPSDFGDFIAGSVMCIPSGEGSADGVPRKLDVVTPQKLDTHRWRNRSEPFTEGDPTMITIANRDATTDNWYCEVDPFPSTGGATNNSAGQISYRYKKRLTDLSANADTIELPDENMNVLIAGVIALWRSYTGGEAHKNDYMQWQGMALAKYAGTDTRSTDSSPSVVPGDVFGSRPGGSNALF